MVELICVVAAHLSIEQCIDVLNVFKVNCKGNDVLVFEVSLVFLLVNLDNHMDLVQCRCPKKAGIASFTDGAKSIGNIELKSAARIYWNDTCRK